MSLGIMQWAKGIARKAIEVAVAFKSPEILADEEPRCAIGERHSPAHDATYYMDRLG